MSWRESCSNDNNGERMLRTSRPTSEDIEKRPSTDCQDPSKERIAGPIEGYCRADGVFGQDDHDAL